MTNSRTTMRPDAGKGSAAAGDRAGGLVSGTGPSARSGAKTLPDNGLAEKRLLVAARSGDAAALRDLVQRATAPAWRWSAGFCRNPEDAADLAQDVLVTLLRSLSRFRGDASLSTWIYVVARRACARRQRRAGRQSSLDAPDHAHLLEHADPSPGPASRLDRRRLAARLEDAIASLPAAQRAVLVMRDVEGLSAREVGKVLGLGERAVKSRLHRARSALREKLAPAMSLAAASVPDCADTTRLLSRQLEGELSARACARMEEHMRGCAACGETCAELRRILDACRGYAEKPVPRAVQQAVREAVQRLKA